MQKKKFNPQVTRIKLNPEQAVLTCLCYVEGRTKAGAGGTPPDGYHFYCWRGTKNGTYNTWDNYFTTGAAS